MEKEFYEGNRSKTMPFVINDTVEITFGPAEGKLAVVISIDPNELSMSYLVEQGDGSGDLVIEAKHLKLI
ncbi:hypothetical protein [Neptunicella marina]|uniref:KOW domain-containing protein n=1 Tax=Neptunicella marina TaxID=2125989 RepID=A0A8J6ITL1_9ALTE|nr:hypothetical protein [Neptunicella marina]MBC3765692.1 hypothetical protein [Neptunicella marina]